MTSEGTGESGKTYDDKEQQSQGQEDTFTLNAENYPDTKSTLLYFVQALSTNAYVYLGLFPIPGTDQIIFKIDEAKATIDLLDMLVEHASSMADEREKRELDSILTQLRMNYVSKLQKATKEQPVEEKPEEEIKKEPHVKPEVAEEEKAKVEETLKEEVKTEEKDESKADKAKKETASKPKKQKTKKKTSKPKANDKKSDSSKEKD